MNATLETPPVVVKSSKRKSLVLFLACILFAASGVAMVAAGRDDAMALAATGLFGLGALVAVWRLLSPARLVLSADGLEWFNGHSTWHFAWKISSSSVHIGRPAAR